MDLPGMGKQIHFVNGWRVGENGSWRYQMGEKRTEKEVLREKTGRGGHFYSNVENLSIGNFLELMRVTLVRTLHNRGYGVKIGHLL